MAYNKNLDGYGMINVDGKKAYANRVMCELAHGSPPSLTHEAAHSCGKGNEGCVNPNHLYWGTRADNARDMVGHGASCRGDKSGRRKLSTAQVLDIKRRLDAGEDPAALAEQFGVIRNTIYRIKSGATWQHLWNTTTDFYP